MHQKFNSAFLSPLLLAFIAGCGVYETKTGNNSASRNGANANIDTRVRVSYSDIKAKVFEVSCKTCHLDGHAKGHVTLDDYPATSAQMAKVTSDMLDGSMPLGGALSDDQLTLVRIWLAEGTPEFAPALPVDPLPTATPLPSVSPVAPADPAPTATPSPIDSPTPVLPQTPTPTPIASPTPAPSPGQLVATYSSIRDHVFAPKCLKCHVPGGVADGIPLDTYDGMMAQTDQDSLILPGAPEASDLVNAIEKNRMPNPRTHIPAVTADELNVIKLWITNGATNQ